MTEKQETRLLARQDASAFLLAVKHELAKVDVHKREDGRYDVSAPRSVWDQWQQVAAVTNGR